MNKYRKHVSRLRVCTMPDLQLKYEFALQSRRPTDNIAPYFKADRWPVKAWPKGSLSHQRPHDCLHSGSCKPAANAIFRAWSKMIIHILWQNLSRVDELFSHVGAAKKFWACLALISSVCSSYHVFSPYHLTWRWCGPQGILHSLRT